MDPRAALLQQESDENNRFRNKSIGMHNLRAKLREQLKGYSHVRGFPLETESRRGGDDADGARTDSLNVRRDSMRRRNSSVTRQSTRYDPEDSDGERKYKQRRPRKKESLLLPRLFWLSVYVSLCFVAYKGLKYFSSDTVVPLCLPCAGSNQCGVLDEEFVVPVDSLGGVPFGTVFPKKASLQCRTDLCVPSHVADPQALCRVVSDEALLYRTRRLLQDGGDTEEQNKRFQEYFRRRAMREEGLAGALSPNSGTPSTPVTPSAEPSTPTNRPTTPTPVPTVPTVPTTPSNRPTTPTPVPNIPGGQGNEGQGNQNRGNQGQGNQGNQGQGQQGQGQGNQNRGDQNQGNQGNLGQGQQGQGQGNQNRGDQNQGNQGQQGQGQGQGNQNRGDQGQQQGNQQQQSNQQQQGNQQQGEQNRDQFRTSPPTPTGTTTPPPQSATPPKAESPKAEAPKAETPKTAPAPSPEGEAQQGNYANGAFSLKSAGKVVSLRELPAGMLGGGGDCNTLRYEPTRNEGYANLTSTSYMAITEVENYEQCCSICANEKDCAGWTRVAGGDASVRQCYLHSNFLMDPNSAARAYNWQPKEPTPIYPPNPNVRYTAAVPIMFESGTKNGNELPAYLYGCPYPPSASGKCEIPPGCNCGGGVCYPGCLAPNVKPNAEAPLAATAGDTAKAPSSKTPAAAAGKDIANAAAAVAKSSTDLADALAASDQAAAPLSADQLATDLKSA